MHVLIECILPLLNDRSRLGQQHIQSIRIILCKGELEHLVRERPSLVLQGADLRANGFGFFRCRRFL